jgi:hypothetical protein
MNENSGEQSGDKLSMGLSVFIALCVVAIFCAISIGIVENVESLPRHDKDKHVTLQNSKDFADLAL